MKEALTFDDVLIQPQFSTIDSRKDVSLSTNFAGLRLDLPIISANMDTITGVAMAKAMSSVNALGCLHRFGTIAETVAMYKQCSKGTAVSIGLGDYEHIRALALLEAGASIFVLDVAHGAQQAVVHQVRRIQAELPSYVQLIVGNFATASSVSAFLYILGNNDLAGIKVGIGPGSACTTRIKTGVGYPQLSAIMEIAKVTSIPVIADGGIRSSGDIAKALAAGARMVMLGGMLAGTDETPGEVFHPEGNGPQPALKVYRGSASKESYTDQGKAAQHRTPEGETFTVPYKGSVTEVLQDIEGGLRSAMTYVGARTLNEFRKYAEFVKVSNSTVLENGSHGKNK